MIYGNNVATSAPIRLYGVVADNFLESVGVSIFDDGDIAIGESIYDLSTACDILEESGIVLCEDCIVLEGKQAEEYKARKAKELGEKSTSDYERIIRRGHVNRMRGKDSDVKSRVRKAHNMVDNEDKRRYEALEKARNSDYNRDYQKNLANARKHFNNMAGKVSSASDAVDRHMRRHPKQYKESTIFSDIEII